ncbi:MAG: anhydro-N-acetylmuramic acid kinase, partial [Saprospiraceae bacterium]|nr:anhydro-N-acetylmuramic acid kinase [Saprospiraceae bacterium]
MKVIGLMSGSSLDGVDIAFADFQMDGEQISFELIKAETIAFSEV